MIQITSALFKQHIYEQIKAKIFGLLPALEVAPGKKQNVLEVLCAMTQSFADKPADGYGPAVRIRAIVQVLSKDYKFKNIGLNPRSPKSPLSMVPNNTSQGKSHQSLMTGALGVYQRSSLATGAYAMHVLHQYAGTAEQTYLEGAYILSSGQAPSKLSTNPCWRGSIRHGVDTDDQEFALYSTATLKRENETFSIPEALPIEDVRASKDLRSELDDTRDIDDPVGSTSHGRDNLSTVMGFPARVRAEQLGQEMDQKPKKVTIKRNGKELPADLYKTYNWLHRIADSLHGPSEPSNLFLGTAACNARMQILERWVRKLRQKKIPLFVGVDVYYKNKDGDLVLDVSGESSNEIPCCVIYKIKHEGEEHGSGVEFFFNPADHRPILDPEPHIIKALLFKGISLAIDRALQSKPDDPRLGKEKRALADLALNVQEVLRSNTDANFRTNLDPSANASARTNSIEPVNTPAVQLQNMLQDLLELSQDTLDQLRFATEMSRAAFYSEDPLFHAFLKQTSIAASYIDRVAQMATILTQRLPVLIEENQTLLESIQLARQAGVALVLENLNLLSLTPKVDPEVESLRKQVTAAADSVHIQKTIDQFILRHPTSFASTAGDTVVSSRSASTLDEEYTEIQIASQEALQQLTAFKTAIDDIVAAVTPPSETKDTSDDSVPKGPVLFSNNTPKNASHDASVAAQKLRAYFKEESTPTREMLEDLLNNLNKQDDHRLEKILCDHPTHLSPLWEILSKEPFSKVTNYDRIRTVINTLKLQQQSTSLAVSTASTLPPPSSSPPPKPHNRYHH